MYQHRWWLSSTLIGVEDAKVYYWDEARSFWRLGRDAFLDCYEDVSRQIIGLEL